MLVVLVYVRFLTFHGLPGEGLHASPFSAKVLRLHGHDVTYLLRREDDLLIRCGTLLLPLGSAEVSISYSASPHIFDWARLYHRDAWGD